MNRAKVGDVRADVVQNGEEVTKRSVASWSRFSSSQKCKYYLIISSFLPMIFVILFTYVCLLGVVSTAFSLLASGGLGKIVQASALIKDPISALVVGMLVTVVLQSATTTTNILVTMVAANMITVHDAIPVMIGSELGSSLVNALISLAYAGQPEQFCRAFSAAVLGDVFNVCSLFVIFPLELATSLIETLSWWIVDPLISEQGLSFKTLELLTDPVTRMILEVNEAEVLNASIRPELFPPNHTFVLRCAFSNGSRIYACPYKHVFVYSTLSDQAIGWMVLAFAIPCLIACLFAIVFLIQKMLDGHAAKYVKNLLSRECPGRWKPCTGYVVMAVGLIVTLLIQSNSIFSSSLTPLVGSGVVTLEQMYPLILGSNIGTTFSGVLAAFSADGSRFEKALHMAMCQVIYNIIGTFLFYIIPPMRKFPIYLSLKLGHTTNRYRWFIVIFVLVFFLIIPFTVIGLSLLPEIVMVITVSSIFLLTVSCVSISVAQEKCKDCLPKVLQTWDFIPIYLRSLAPYDQCMVNFFTALPFVGKFFQRNESYDEDNVNKKVDKLVKLSGHTQV
ncbi:unnamed protein product [Caenorhabditis auriculariae]|uniref:Uncharacterized protein n=1 Tax=Caenorhabditis auriculariae TaxID=2777116 RepID=A0A8S1GV72_9PELO|nr:unnamed protein product [Caenorhabditis auriculariae]